MVNEETYKAVNAVKEDSEQRHRNDHYTGGGLHFFHGGRRHFAHLGAHVPEEVHGLVPPAANLAVPAIVRSCRYGSARCHFRHRFLFLRPCSARLRYSYFKLAGAEGLEPPSSVLETDSLAIELTPLEFVIAVICNRRN